MEERAFEVYKWILYNVNGWSRDEIDKMTIDDDWSEVEAIRRIIEDGEKYNRV